MSQRGNTRLRFLDRHLGPGVLALLGLAVRVRRRLRRDQPADGACVVLCLGAIGDLLLLSRVVQQVRPTGPLWIACTPENEIAVSVFPGLYDRVLTVRSSRPWSLALASRGATVSRVFDSTQWANVSALQVALLRLSQPGVAAEGFDTGVAARHAIYDHLTEHRADVHEVQNFANLFGYADLRPSSLVTAHRAKGRRVVLHLWPSGTRSHLKQWPEEHWATLARGLAARGCDIYLSGGPADQSANADFISAAGVDITNLAGRMSLQELARFLGDEVALFVGVNTGTMHLAALAGTPVIAITGPTDPARWGPIGDHNVSLLPASGRVAYLNRGFEYPASDREAYALDRLEPATVLACVDNMLSGEPFEATLAP